MTSEELQWAVKSLIAGMIWTSGRNDTEADVWDEVDALFAERTRRDAKPAPVGASSTAVDETQGDAIPCYTAEEVAERLVRVVKAEIFQTYSPMVYVGQLCVSIEDSNASAARKADAIRATIRRTLEAKP